MASSFRIGESLEYLELVSMSIAKGDCIVKDLKVELGTSFSPSDQVGYVSSAENMYGWSYQRDNTHL